jgi:hypothetical protein
VIPRSGYRADDMLDDVEVALPGENPSAEVRMAAIVHGHTLDDDCCTAAVQNPSAEGFGASDALARAAAEVRERRGVYRLATARSDARHFAPATSAA